MQIRPETTADHDAIRQLVVTAFGSDAEGDLVERIRASPGYVPELALVAEIDGEIVGHVMISGATIRHRDGERPVVMLSPLAVEPGHQRQGVGAALVERVCSLADDRGEPLVVLEGDPRYYGRLGFEHAEMYGLSLPLPDWAPAEAAQVRLLSGYDPEISSLRGEVI